MYDQKKLEDFCDAAVNKAINKKAFEFDNDKINIDLESKNIFYLAYERAKKKINSECLFLEQDKNNCVSNELVSAKEKMYIIRESLKQELFYGVKKELKKFVKTEEYINFIELELKKFIDANNNKDIIIEFSAGDKQVAEYINKKLELEFFISEQDFIGGYKIYIGDSRIVLDKSFLSRLENIKSKFNKFKLPVI